MARVLVVYHSETGNTARLAEEVARGAREAGAEVDLKKVQDVPAEALLDYDAILAGAPTYYGLMSAQLKKLFDQSVRFHKQLTGKVGGAFTSCGVLGGGNETTVLSILQAMLIHGMIVQGTASGAHFGAVAIGKPNERACTDAVDLGRRVAELAAKLADR
jgi:NAD(P)H dehydrogenase (quinone)